MYIATNSIKRLQKTYLNADFILVQRTYILQYHSDKYSTTQAIFISNFIEQVYVDVGLRNGLLSYFREGMLVILLVKS